MTLHRVSALLSAAVLAATCAACGDGEVTATKDSAMTGDAGSSQDTAVVDIWPKTGDYYLGIWAKAFDLKLYFKVKIEAEGSSAAGGVIKTFEIRAVATDGAVSDDAIGLAKDVTVDKDGHFLVDIDDLVLPGSAKSAGVAHSFSPTGTDVPLILKLAGTLKPGGMFCGTVDGFVPQFGQTLAGSTFRAVPWGTETKPAAETSCEGDIAKNYAHIDKCPVIQAGVNTLKSAERDRKFQVLLPAAGTPTAATPVVFLFHGVGGSAKGILGESQFAKLQETENFVLVVPESERKADGTAVLKSDWYYAGAYFELDNPDMVFFDDMLKCVGEAFPQDPSRIYVTGMSGGGLMSTFTALHRSKVIAAAAPFSGGYLLPFPKSAAPRPFLASHGGPTDAAYGQDFLKLATALIGDLLASGHPVVTCDHGTGHKWPAAMTAAAWTFLKAYQLDKPADPWAAGLPAVFPAYCKVAK